MELTYNSSGTPEVRGDPRYNLVLHGLGFGGYRGRESREKERVTRGPKKRS